MAEPATILDLLEASAKDRQDDAAIIVPGERTIGYAELLERVRGLAGQIHAAGAGRSRVGIALPNGPEMSVALLGGAVAGTAVPFNPASTESEFRTYFERARVAAVLTDNGRVPQAVTAAGVLGLPVIEFRDGPPEPLDVRPSPHDNAVVLLTSGTTGKGKLVPLTHQNLVAGATEVARSVALTPNDRVLSMWELHHIGGIVDLLLAPLISRGSVIAAGGFDARAFFRLLQDERPTWFQGVPATLTELLRVGGFAAHRNLSLRFLRSVAAPLAADQFQALERAFGVPVITTFGMTEASPLITSTRLPPAIRKPGSTGLPCGTEVAILGPNGSLQEDGATGEVAVRGPNVFSGYEDDAEANALSFRDGWFVTGDLGFLDHDGELFLTGRSKDIINRGGEKIAPQEVDEVILAHPSVADAACFPVPHPTLGEEVAVAVVAADGQVITARDLKRHCRAKLAGFKVPKHLLVLDTLPRNPIGKVLRSDLTHQFAVRAAALSGSASVGNPLEAAIAEIWADELDCEAVGLDDDFAVLGGDSLSSIRLVLAVESLTGLQIPADAIDQIDTVRQMAALLVALGATTKPPFGPKRDRVQRNRILDEVTERMVAPDGLAEDVVSRCRSEVELETVRHTLENVSPPHELVRLLKHGGGARPGALRAVLDPAVRVTRRRHELLSAVERDIAHASNPLAWRRSAVSGNVDLFSDPETRSVAKTLIVGFSSRAMRLTAPTYQVLCALDPSLHDLLVLRDPDRRHYFSGVPGVGTTPEAMARWLQQWSGSQGYDRTVCIGTSAGGLPAVCVAILNDWPRVMAAGADNPARHPQFDEVLSHCADRLARFGRTEVVIAFSAGKERDNDAASALKARLPTARMIGDDRFDSHPLLYLLHRKGELGTFLAKNLLG